MERGVAGAPEQHAAGELAIAAGAARLLVVRLRRGRQRPVDDERGSGLVDAHPERTGGDDDVEAVIQKRLERPARGAPA